MINEVFNVGTVIAEDLTFDKTQQALSCTSTGGPPTTVTWRKNGQPLTIDGTTYQQSQRVVNASIATYENILISVNISNFVGRFTCTVSNVRTTAPVERTVVLNGELYQMYEV